MPGSSGEWNDAFMVTWPRWRLSWKALVLRRRKGGLWCDWFLPQLQVGGALQTRHKAELGRDQLRAWIIPLSPLGSPSTIFFFYSQGLCNHCTQLVLYPLRTIWILLGVSLLGLSDLSGSWRNKNKRKDKWSGCEGKQRSSAGPCVSSMLCCGAWLQWAVSHLHMRMISETVITLSRTPTMCNCGKWCEDDSSNKILFACKKNTEMCNENMDFNLCSLILRGNWHILIFKSVI